MKVADGFYLLATFVHVLDFGFAGAMTGTFLANGGPVEGDAHANGDVAEERFAFINRDNAIIIFPRLGGILRAPSGIGAHHWFRRFSGESVDKGPGDTGAIFWSVKLMK